VITPTTHGSGPGGHDERLTKKDIFTRKIVYKKIYEQMEQAAYNLFDYGSRLCQKRGLVLVDTKYEFGLYRGELTLMDEIHTPDSSRFWIAGTYEKRLRRGAEPDNFDKEFLRLWYADKGYTGSGTPPPMSQQLIIDLAKRYIEVYEKITGRKFNAYRYPIERSIKECLETYA
jgi:phosphoribosylaminoimidazole-succinocarboxamide synthase